MDYYAAFILGLIGSLHCGGMCGPLALGLPHPGGSASRFFASRFAYNFGRIITYAVIGLIFGTVGQTLALAGVQRTLSILLGLLVLLGLLFSRKFALWKPVTTLVERLKSTMTPLFRQRTVSSIALLGLLNGLLPCGLVYVAAAGATASHSVLTGCAYMLAFGAGTLPMMLTISISGKLVPFALRLKLRRAIPFSALLLATLLILRGLALGVPYVSPTLTSPCCHH